MRQDLTVSSGAPRVFVIHENDAWVEPLRTAFEARHVPFAEWFLDEGVLDLTKATTAMRLNSPPRSSPG